MKNLHASRRHLLIAASPLIISLLVVSLLMVSCSKEPPQPVATAPLVTVDSAVDNAADVLKAEVAAGGIPAKYSASFVDNQLKGIAETRQSGASTQQGDYEFYGARLTKYNGAALQGETPIELEFDLRGAITRSRAGSGEVPAEEISAIRARAQLLRSHALAQRSVRAHATR